MTQKAMVFTAEITLSITKTCRPLFVFTTKFALANLTDETSVLSRSGVLPEDENIWATTSFHLLCSEHTLVKFK